jgi:hypothetical protein
VRAWIAGVVLFAAACHQGNGLGGPDLLPPPDLAPAADLTPAPDLLPPPNCGQIVGCALKCGTQSLTCIVGCGQNAPPQAIAEAGALVACAAQNCLSADGGASGTLQIFQCLSDKCPMQLSGCEGLGLGGL